jgi:hypothetical protein
MNALDRLLRDEVNQLLDRIAAAVPGGSLGAVSATSPTLRARLDETDARLSALRGSLLEAYGAWEKTLDDLENLWALAAWKREEDTQAAA